MFSYLIQFQNITDTKGISKSFATSQSSHVRQQHKYIWTKPQQNSCLPNALPILYIEQAPTNTPPDALSIVTNTSNSNTSHIQTYVLKPFKKPIEVRKIANGYTTMSLTMKNTS